MIGSVESADFEIFTFNSFIDSNFKLREIFLFIEILREIVQILNEIELVLFVEIMKEIADYYIEKRSFIIGQVMSL